MGDSTSWIAVRGIPKATVIERLNLKALTDGEPPSSEFYGAKLDDWYVVRSNLGNAFWSPERQGYGSIWERVSQGCEVVSGDVEEHVMYSSAGSCKDGVLQWLVIHNNEYGIKHLEVMGDPPSGFAAIRERLLQQQDAEGGAEAEVDYVFEVPIELAKSVVGFRYDDPPDGEEDVLLPIATDREGLVSKLLGLLGFVRRHDEPK